MKLKEEVKVVEVNWRLIKAALTPGDLKFQTVVFGRCVTLTPLDEKLEGKIVAVKSSCSTSQRLKLLFTLCVSDSERKVFVCEPTSARAPAESRRKNQVPPGRRRVSPTCAMEVDGVEGERGGTTVRVS